jgi:hypothetical protein
MYELTGKIKGVSFDYVSGTPLVTLELLERKTALDMVDTLREYDKLAVKIDRYKAKRSLNANAYAWLLIGKIADSTRSSKEEVYLKMLKDYGQSDLVSVLAHIPVACYFKYYEEAGESTLNGKLFKHYRVYKGSSEFDTREMSIFIDGIVSEAKNLGIETMTPNEIAKMKDLWKV